jgi:hypothetical protein
LKFPPLDTIKRDDLKFQRMKWRCLHPYRTFRDDEHTTKKYQMSLTTETKNGVPHGLCFVEFLQDEDDKGKFVTFFGFCIMYEGEMHGGPAIFVRNDGKVQRFNMMIHGRSAGDGILYIEDDDANFYSMRGQLPLKPDQPI